MKMVPPWTGTMNTIAAAGPWSGLTVQFIIYPRKQLSVGESVCDSFKNEHVWLTNMIDGGVEHVGGQLR